MTTVPEVNEQLRGTDGFLVESPDGDIGSVEEVWLGDEDEPRALAVRTSEGRRALLLGDAVLAVDRENRWVVVPPEPELLELDAPRLTTGDGAKRRVTASWATTGALVHIPERRSRAWTFLARRAASIRATCRKLGERPLWQLVGLVYTALGLIVALVITLVFVLAGGSG